MFAADNNIYIIYYVILLSMLVLTLFSGRFKVSQALKYIVGWAGIILVILVGYVYQDILENVFLRLKSTLVPYDAVTNEDNSVSVTLDQNGHFQMNAFVEGKPIRFMVDTGATRTVLTQQDAQKLGIDPNKLDYNRPTETANGVVYDAAIRLSEIRIGTIVVRDVRASISQNMTGQSLIGMSFLNKLKGYKVEGNRLTLWN